MRALRAPALYTTGADGCCVCAEKDTGKQVQPVFISIDPERDSVKQVRDYVKGAHRRCDAGV